MDKKPLSTLMFMLSNLHSSLKWVLVRDRVSADCFSGRTFPCVCWWRAV